MRKHTLIILFVSILLSGTSNTEGQLSRNIPTACYPQSWWIGMKYNRLLLIIQGYEVAMGTVSISHPGITVLKQYPGNSRDNSSRIVEIEIAPATLSGNVAITVARAGGNATCTLELKQRIPAVKPKKLNGSDVIYQILPDRFANGDKTNDAVTPLLERADRSNPSGIHGGDIQGIIQNINYIERLGVTAVELTPLYESNQYAQSYDKFAPTHHYKTDARLGTLSECLQMVSAFHSRNIKVIQTFVLNKTGDKHPFYQQPPLPDWYYPRPTGIQILQEGRGQVVFGDPNSSKEDMDRNVKIWEMIDMPPLNQTIEEVRRFLIQHVLWWIETTGIDGIKIEQTHFNTPQLLNELGKAVSDEYPGLNIISAPQTDMVVHNYFWKNGYKNEKYFTHITDMPLYSELMDAFADYRNPNEALKGMYKIIASDRIYDNPVNETILQGDGHSMTRLFTLAEKDPDIFRMYMGFILTSGRIPAFMYGSEIQMEGLALEGYGFVRGDMPGGWDDDRSSIFTLSGLTPKQRESYLYISSLLEWRKASADLMKSPIIHFEPRDGIYAYFRCAAHKKLLVIINNNPDLPRRMESDRFTMTAGKINKVYNVITGETTSEMGTLVLNPKSIVILELTCEEYTTVNQ